MIVAAALGALGVIAACGRDDAKPAPRARVIVDREAAQAGGALAEAWTILARIDWSADPAIDWSRPVTGADTWVAPIGRAGTAACARCHQEEATRYAEHAMARTGLAAVPVGGDPVLAAAFDVGGVVTHPGSGYTYRPFRDGARLLVEERLDGDDGVTLHETTVEITHTYAAGKIGQAFAYQLGSYVYQVPIDWYPTQQRWALDPSFGGGNARFGRPLLSFCLGCHVDAPTRRAASVDLVQLPLSSGVGCERCHGPGAAHAESDGVAPITNPGALPAARQLDVCAQCHLQGTAEILRVGQDAFSFVPGDALHAHRVNLVEGAPTENQFQLTGQVDRMARSKCFTASAGALTCTTCHDPHASAAAQPPESWRDACLTCHAEAACTAPADARQANGDACADCHMRRDTASDFRLAVPGVSLPVVDHWIRRRIDAPAPVDAVATRPRAGEVRPFAELAGETLGGDDVAALRAVGLHASGRSRLALPLLVDAAADRPPVRELYAYLADQYRQVAAEIDDPSVRAQAQLARHAALAAAVRAAPDDPATLLEYADAVAEARPDEAARAIDRVLAIDATHPDALTRRAVRAFQAGAVAEARRDAELAAQLAPHPLEAETILAALVLAEDDVAGAIEHLERARRAAPGDLAVLDELIALRRRQGADAEVTRLAQIRSGFVARGARLEDSRARQLLGGAN